MADAVATRALLIIDMQRDFCSPGGYAATAGLDVTRLASVVGSIGKLLAAARAAGMLVVYTREGHLPDLSDCPPEKLRRSCMAGAEIGSVGPLGRLLIRGEYGQDIIDELRPLPGELVIDKPGKGAFYATPLQAELQRRGIAQLVLMGVTTEVCVQTTMREANDRGYECLLIEDGTESYFPAYKAATLEMIRAQGAIVGWTAGSAAVIDAVSGYTS